MALISRKLQVFLMFVWTFCSSFNAIHCSYVAQLVQLAMLHQVFYLATACITVVCSDIRFTNSTLQQPSAVPLGDSSGTQTVIARAVRSEPNVDEACHEMDVAKPNEIEPNGENGFQPEDTAETSSGSEASHDFDMAMPAKNEPNGESGFQPAVDIAETSGNEANPGLDVAQPGVAEPTNDGAIHAADVAQPMDVNAALVQRVLAYSQMEDKALGDRLIFQLAPAVYQRQGLKSVYDRLRWQANPHRHPLGGESRALAFKAFEHLHAVFHRLEEAQMLASGSGKE
ncbi:hypothetical protein Vretimale_14250 [Volvox reticuliferus]|uniref:Uncharacterized protein n=4 Tax=Volvox reticuliferus TaxID=1737510 RepID=A0A8J4LUK1_9CHLO|nr:hypothetical protein Vretifemale_15239 [Volvox reticuliferus]GIL87090.1 hypothetical protein Vretifemale_15239 [Volvox reticuliferus]GIM10619.1 hypothetical protein Vretimale_14250 [Volvox reticuliferus]GIM10620.1 hypothetical protein Vretimale_14250 [Volvox reticuliferus]GIM10624.1 hypothetical protein Vretimale_14250 [Volvox reticuliferus]